MANHISRREFACRIAAATIIPAPAEVQAFPAAGPVSGRPSGGRQAPVAGILGMTTGKADLRIPASLPKGTTWRYGLALPFQAGPETAGLFCNIRAGFHDFEAGNDLVLFGDTSNISADHAQMLNRNHKESHPRTGQPSIMVKYPCRGGFVPLGAKREDGSAHPHAGTGFSVTQVLAWPLGGSGAYRGSEHYEYLELQQYSYDGKAFRMLNTQRIQEDELLSGWVLSNPPIRNAIPDGNDLLMGMAGGKVDFASWMKQKRDAKVGAGLTRWRRGKEGWRPVSFVPITPLDGSFEPSVIRDLDGALLFLARGREGPIRVWRSSDGGKAWKKIIHVVGESSPSVISLNQATDGTPYVATNLYDVLLRPLPERFRPKKNSAGVTLGAPLGREKLCLWALNASRDALDVPILVRDSEKEFGLAPSGDTWNVDHPSAMTVRLRDQHWHNVIVMRICDHAEVRAGYLPAPQTGTYVEEVISKGNAISQWNF